MVREDKVTRSNAILSKCHSCSGYYSDEKNDCGVSDCPLYPWMPYRKKVPDLSWTEFNPKIKGKVTWEDSSRTLSEEQKQLMSDRLRVAREKRLSHEE